MVNKNIKPRSTSNGSDLLDLLENVIAAQFEAAAAEQLSKP